MEELKKCGLERCGNEEFLVWKCDFCGVSFCENHRQRQDHSCVSLETPELCQNSDILGADVSVSSSGGVSVSTRDMFRAVETRHDQLDLISSGKIHANVKSSTLQTDEKMLATLGKVKATECVIENSKSEKQKNIAQKTKNMLLRNRAEGNSEVPFDERFYITCSFPNSSSSSSKCLYFHKNITVGEALRSIGCSCTLLAYGSPVRPDSMTLSFSIVGDVDKPDSVQLCRWDNNASLKSFHDSEDVMDLGVQPVLISESIEDQKRLVSEQKESTHVHDNKTGGEEPMNTVPPIPKPSYTHKYIKGDRVIYRNVELGIIVGVHKEVDPPYYTIQMSAEGGGVKEKQTDGVNLSPFREPTISNDQTSNENGDTAVFSIRLSSGGKVRRIDDIPLSGTVGDLKRIISMHTGVLPAKQKLLYKGKVLKVDSMNLRNTEPSASKKVFSIDDNALVMLMTMSS